MSRTTFAAAAVVAAVALGGGFFMIQRGQPRGHRSEPDGERGSQP